MRVLLAEDDAELARQLASALTDAGFAVDHAVDGADAEFRGQTEDYDAAVLDLGLPGMDGLSVLDAWRAAGRRLPVLVLT
ncbi:response regulator, partial [Arenimonas caeni]